MRRRKRHEGTVFLFPLPVPLSQASLECATRLTFFSEISLSLSPCKRRKMALDNAEDWNNSAAMCCSSNFHCDRVCTCTGGAGSTGFLGCAGVSFPKEKENVRKEMEKWLEKVQEVCT